MIEGLAMRIGPPNKPISLDPVNGINVCRVPEMVLQLDICRFTKKSQRITPMELAQAMHHIFSSFDACVQTTLESPRWIRLAMYTSLQSG